MVIMYTLLLIIWGLCYRAPVTKSEDIKTWRANTNFDNARNWVDGQLPCPNDRVIFPATSPVAIFMPESFSVAEMILPLNGELIFPGNAVFNLTGKSQAGSCFGKDVNFKLNSDKWYDSKNWNISSDRAFPRTSSRHNSAVPHAYRVPCRTDKAFFPSNSAFRVLQIQPATSVSALHINNLEYTQSDFEALLGTPIGKLLFPDGAPLQITQASCEDKTGCVCGNDEPKIFAAICQNEWPCPNLPCFDPFEVKGHCCPMCAAKIVISYESQFRMEKLLLLQEGFQNTATFGQVESFTSKTADGEIQLTFVDGKGENQVANRLAQLVYNALSGDTDKGNLYGISAVRIFKSEKWSIGPPGSDSYTSSGISSGGIAALVIVMLLVLGFFIGFYLHRRRQLEGFSFARFDLRSDKIELELGTTPHDELEPEERPPVVPEEQSKGFDNPIYGTGASSEASSSVEEAPSEIKDFVENPMFMIFENSKKEEDF